MAGNHFRSFSATTSSSSSSSRSSTSSSLIITVLSLLTIISLYFLFTSSSSNCIIPNQTASLSPNPKPNPNSPPPLYSFVASLDKFLSSASSRSSQYVVSPDSPEELDGRIWKREADIPMTGPSVVRIYVYDMPAKFTYDLLRMFQETYRDTTNLTSNGSPVHRLIEQHSIDYWLWSDLIAPESERLLKNVIRVHRQEEADLFYIPFFTTISFFLMEKQQCKALYREALKWVTDQPAWQRSEGKDHILPVHHPWSFKSVRRFMKNAIWLLPDMDSTGNWWLYIPYYKFCLWYLWID